MKIARIIVVVVLLSALVGASSTLAADNQLFGNKPTVNTPVPRVKPG